MRKRIFVIPVILLLVISMTACTLGVSETDGAVGEYYFEYEKAPMTTYIEIDSKMVLDGKGKGEYHREGAVHKITYTFDDPDIVITDKKTGIHYRGTLKEGNLLIYDGGDNETLKSEFLFKSKNAH